ncbi:DNA primase DnaG [Lactobacillus plantarum JDM1] [Lactiplantibacillus plantarum]|uniref:DNA primase n=1 Tax=Lactiplantibacillus plantarum CMPG5300 TaxID=1304889 RepID=A0AAW3FPF5_LACPN|nr:DNA primase [Lactiplantibacillus plantarum]ATI71528.1 DNA primase [Lactiplantibacillus plantarum]KGH43165.1 DNA primase DnaG [Lactiplantibacillus plantarum CMPG5300]MBS0953726.1 DNA primase [Lactiplantibacillus plantarum]MCZ2138911.1 DNA primase [Lactiplantibacillus plantarum]MCZ2275396.1 DNA primase [Lactiplantibacillus plantarum]
MANRIPEEKVEQVRSAVNIADFIGQYVQLKKAGKNLFGLCPFHEERTPSFSVNEQKQIFHCFSCGRGGNVFSFIMDLENLSFPEAVVKVADFGHIDLPASYTAQSQPAAPKDQQQADLLKLYADSAKMYQHILVNTELGEPALKYLHERGLDDETIKTFGIGYAPANQLLLDFFKEHQTDYQLLRQSGLFIENQAGDLRDRFVDRVLFPIKDASGRVIAFSGRILKKSPNEPKYLNSPETKLFNKRSVLFNFDLARGPIRQQKSVVLFEGFMDVIAAYRSGIQNGVASMGTSLTDEQIYMLERVTDTLYVCYDSDMPGQKATDRALKLLGGNSRLNLGVIQMPDGMDPDEYLRAQGQEKFVQVFEDGKQTPTAFEMQYLKHDLNLQNTPDQLTYLQAVLQQLAQLASSVEQDLYLNQLVAEFDLDKDDLKQQLRSLVGQQAVRRGGGHSDEPQVAPPPAPAPLGPPPATVDGSTNSGPLSRVEKAERLLLYRLLNDHDVWLRVMAIAGFHFVHDSYQQILVYAEAYFKTHNQFDLGNFTDFMTDSDLQPVVTSLEFMDVANESSKEEIADLVNVIMNQQPLVEQINSKKAELTAAKQIGNRDLVQQLTLALIDLYRQQQQVQRADN